MAEDPARVLVIGGDGERVDTLCVTLAGDSDVHRVPDVDAAEGAVFGLRPDLVVLDAALLGDRARHLCAALRADTRTAMTPVVLLQAGADGAGGAGGAGASARAWRDLGIADVLSEPVDADLARARVAWLVELRRLRMDMALAVRCETGGGIMNRRVFDGLLRRESGRLRRSDGSLALLLLDIDHFRDFRARHGAAAAEDCYHRVADCVSARLRRPPDVVSRFTADQVACLLPETDLRGARVVAETIRESVAALALPHGDSPVADHVTVSVGVAARRCSGPEVDAWLLSECLERLSRARREGCNRVVAGDGGPTLMGGGLERFGALSGGADMPPYGYSAL
ncbi:GGDEF domain-containing protein [Roseospira goensis]|uniref:diguanylate cyclase n=1 Tax=Roseospira goensis TaxID=391922 RepID=A0A7W6WJF8_9PROT|nr:diguanylate cyclase [Roseospira goensis]MBB4284447.1 diguanylate cyclase (GGDEF)-like protein [Roseospira goensis]